ncbi:MAG: Leucine-tRNA ligase [Candidatus Woesebacteria bacterium GW2011_GWB1_40_12]|uniref:Leucine--tRNA ligase n=1 Tax=Candidatus Woesebacteria bacterium GW2011_GWB1_40_12 TaxID=1618576 RepID=A0A0G0T877_9BACT|nr:MAG: Leucine-tRNA ligase [Candidatus Woesebacteria bacterium GW2011_GWB1_40_12]
MCLKKVYAKVLKLTNMDNIKYDHAKIEKKWQDRWEKENIYFPDLSQAKEHFYNLWMFPYPSAEGLHAGHTFASTGSDVFGRFIRMQGKAVFQPIGYDSFGIHSENYAIKIGENPNEVVKRTTKHYEEQMRSLGHGYDWRHTVTTSDPDYYRWTQWLFLKMWEAGLAYKKLATVNFCPSCKTVLADEQVMTPAQAGKEPKDANGEVVPETPETKVCERCGTIVEKKDLDQWFFRITKYADDLLEGLEKIDWSSRVKLAQKNWIGKSHGMLIKFKIENSDDEIEVFTTRPDTLNAVTFIAISDEALYNRESIEKIGEPTGKYAIDPLSGRKLPIWKTNYVAPGYGTGAVMGVPAHDERDMEFAKKYHLDIVQKDPDQKLWKEIEDKKFGYSHTNFHLRDWLVSRQRYWGAPIPMINCPKCDWVAVPEKELPVLLPNISDYKPEGTGKGPLANHKEFYQVTCPKCGGDATRETDVMDTFVDSSWYFLRYPSSNIESAPFDKEITKRWLPVDLYFGGAEHSVLHLMYARFVTKVLHDLKLLDFDEPFPKFFAHGLMIKDGVKMSKSKGNVINPDQYVSKFGADTLRLYVMFLGPMDASPDFRDSGIEGMQRFVARLWKLFNEASITDGQPSKEVAHKLNQTVKKVTEDMYNFKYNTAIASIMELMNTLEDNKTRNLSASILKSLALLLAPFAPHLAEEVWVKILGQPFSIHKANWPKYDNSLIGSDTVTIIIQVNGKLRSHLVVSNKQSTKKEDIETLSKKDENVGKWLKNHGIKKVIFVSGKLINFVI